MRDFHNYKVWSRGHQFALSIYKKTKGFPKEELFGLIRALSDVPGAYLYLEGLKFKIYKSHIISNESLGEVGEIVKADKKGLYLQTKNGLLALLDVQLEGKKRMDYMSFINGHPNLLHEKLQ